MKKFAPLFLFVLVALVSFGQRPKVLTKNFDATIPFELNFGKIVVPIELNGNNYRFQLDTGGSFLISNHLYEDLQPKRMGTARVRGVNNQPMDLKMVRIDTVDFGGVLFKNFQALVMDSTKVIDCYGIDGVVGKEFFYGTALQFDKEEGEIRFTDNPENLNTSGARSSDFLFNRLNGLAEISVSVNDEISESVVFDTGSDHLLSLQRANIQKLKDKGHLKGDQLYRLFGSASVGLTGDLAPAANQYYIFVESMKMGSISINDFVSDISTEGQGRIGTGLIENGIVTIDYRGQKFYFESSSDYTNYNIAIPRYGFLALPRDDQFEVTATLAGSPAKLAGLRVDDVLVSINGFRFDELAPEDHCTYWLEGFPWEKDTDFVVKVLRQGKAITFEFKAGVSN